MNFSFVALQMVTVSLPILVGWAAHKLGFMDDDFDVRLSTLVLNVSMPCMILASLGSAGGLPSTGEMLWMLAATATILVVSGLLGYALALLMRAPVDERGIYQFIVMFGNCGFIGFPVVQAILGKGSLLLAAIGIIPSNILIFTAGVIMVSGEGGGWKRTLKDVAACFKTPVLISSLVVTACVALGISGFGVASDALTIVGELTTPAALLLTGSSIARYEPLSMLANWRAYVAAAGRLLAGPLLGLLLLRLLGQSLGFACPVNVLAIAVLQMAMPVASNGALYCLEYGKDAQPMMQGTFLSIILSILTIPLVVLLSQ